LVAAARAAKWRDSRATSWRGLSGFFKEFGIGQRPRPGPLVERRHRRHHEDQERVVGIGAARQRAQRAAIHAVHLDIADQHVGQALRHGGQRGMAIAGRGHAVAFAFQRQAQYAQHVRLVVHEKDMRTMRGTIRTLGHRTAAPAGAGALFR
jgi:hypothetical protein